jgi:nitroimidazol reductase NimA-like FMN-containing flavoprotein (pyridoxamine 5'-phosphate oxidase superfamily)
MPSLRTDRIIEDPKVIEEILNRVPVGHLGLSWKNHPYVVPLLFAARDGNIYLHCSDSGMIMKFLRNNPSVCFEVEEFLNVVPGLVPCKYTNTYRSVIAFGTAQILTDPDEKTAGLRLIVAKYAGEEVARTLTKDMVEEYRSTLLNRSTVVFKIRIDQITGKRFETEKTDVSTAASRG